MLRACRPVLQKRPPRYSVAFVKQECRRVWNDQFLYQRGINADLEQKKKVLQQQEERIKKTLIFGQEKKKVDPKFLIQPQTRYEKIKFKFKHALFKKRWLDDIVENVDTILKHQLHPSFTYLMHLINFAIIIPPFYFLYYEYFTLTGWLLTLGIVSQESYDSFFAFGHWSIILCMHMIAWGIWYDISGMVRYPFYARVMGPFWIRQGWCYQTAKVAKTVGAAQPKTKAAVDLHRASLKKVSATGGPKRQVSADDAEAKANKWRQKRGAKVRD